MKNQEIEAAWNYHDQTKHSWQSVHSSMHRLDWSNQPRPVKVYPHLEPIKLPSELAPSGVPALKAISTQDADETRLPTLQDLAAVFYYAAGITKKGMVPGGSIYFRAASCTGALYHIELYLVCSDLPDLPAGIYHFCVQDFALRRLREGDYRNVLREATGGEPAVEAAPATIISSSVYWRNAWKYQSRAYRHCYWDSGTIMANLLAIASAIRMPAKVVTSFVDRTINALLDLDDQREVALQLVPLGRVPGHIPPSTPEFPVLNLEVAPYSRREVDYPPMQAMHAASSLDSAPEVTPLWGEPPPLPNPQPQGQPFPLDLISESEVAADTIEQVVRRRGSSRRFRRAPISYRQLSTILDCSTRGMPADFLTSPENTLNRPYLIVNEVDGLPSGSYVFHRQPAALEQLGASDFRDRAGYLGLEQALPGDASVNVYFLSDLSAVMERYGNRGYRMAQLEAAIMGGRLYLAAYALRLGATGLTFFDDDVTEFFSPHAQGKSVMFLMALGRPQRRPQQNPGRIL